MKSCSKKANILFLHAGAELYGADKVLLELVIGVSKKYHPIVVLPNDGPLVEKFREKNINTIILKYPILRRKIFNLSGIIDYIKGYITFSKKLIKIAKDNRIDLVHVNTTAVFEGIALKKLLKLPLIWHVHEIVVSPKIVNKIITWAVCKYSDLIVVVSNAVKQHLQASNHDDQSVIEIIYNGVPSYSSEDFISLNKSSITLRRELGIEGSSVVIGMIGRINSWKGQSDFLDAVEATLNKISDSHAIVIGGVFEGEEWRKHELLKKIEESPNSSRIHFLNFKKEIIQYHNMFDIFVLPSTNPDPLPTVVLEAMSVGKTVLGYKHGGIIEMVNSSKETLVEPRNIQELSDIIFRYSSNATLREKEGKLNLERQKTMFNVNRYHEDFIQIYKRILGE